jgi:RNA ligase
MGVTEVSMQAEEFVARNTQYSLFAEWCMNLGLTPIFEWCSRKQRIVIDYPEDRLVLIALRHTVSGQYKPYCDLVVLGDRFGIDVVKAYDGTTANMEHLITETRAMEDAEGWIIRFDDGHMLKIKGDWYVRIHKTKDNLVHEKNVVDLLVTEKMDDAKSFMLDDDRRRVDQFETDFWIGINAAAKRWQRYFDDKIVNTDMDRKTWAIQHMKAANAEDPFASSIVFGMFDGKDPYRMIVDTVARHTGTQTKIDSVRNLWGGHRWSYSFDGDS